MNYITLGILIVILIIFVYLSYEKKQNKKQDNFSNIKFRPFLNKTHDLAKYLILEK